MEPLPWVRHTGILRSPQRSAFVGRCCREDRCIPITRAGCPAGQGAVHRYAPTSFLLGTGLSNGLPLIYKKTTGRVVNEIGKHSGELVVHSVH